MKRSFAALCIAVAAGCAFAAQEAGAQPPSGGISVGAAQKIFDEADSRAVELAKSVLAAQGDASSGDRQSLRERLRPVVEETFKARQQLQHAKLEGLRHRLDEIEKSIKEREESKEAIIKSRIEELLLSKPADQEKQQAHNEAIKGAARVRSIPDDIPMVPPPGPLKNVPPGMEIRVRYVQEQMEVNGELQMVTKPIYEIVKSGLPNAAQHDGEQNDGFGTPTRQIGDEVTVNRGAARARGAFDLEGRERLAQLDVEAAEEDRAAAEQDLSRLRQLVEKGAVSVTAVREKEQAMRQAQRALKRAKAMLDILALERRDLASAAEADVAEGEADVRRAEAKVEGAKASVDAALAEINRLKSEAESAKADFEFSDKRFKRMQKLVDEKAVDITLLDEQEQKRESARAAFAAAEAAFLNGSALAERAKAAVEECKQDLNVAKARLHAALAAQERLVGRATTDTSGTQPSRDADSRPANSAHP